MSLLFLLTGAPQGGQGTPPAPTPTPEPSAVTRGGGGGSRPIRRAPVFAVTREYRDAEDEIVILTW